MKYVFAARKTKNEASNTFAAQKNDNTKSRPLP